MKFTIRETENYTGGEIEFVGITHKEMKEIVKNEKQTGLNFTDNTFTFNYNYDNCLMFSQYDSNDLRKIKKDWIICENINTENTIIYYNKDNGITLYRALAFFLAIAEVNIKDVIGINKLNNNEINRVMTYISIFTPITLTDDKIEQAQKKIRNVESKEDIKNYINSYIDNNDDKESLSILIDDFINDKFKYYQEEEYDMIDEDAAYNTMRDIESIGIENFINDMKNRDSNNEIDENIVTNDTNLSYTLEDISLRLSQDITQNWDNKIAINEITSLCKEVLIEECENNSNTIINETFNNSEIELIDKSLNILCKYDKGLIEDIKNIIIFFHYINYDIFYI